GGDGLGGARREGGRGGSDEQREECAGGEQAPVSADLWAGIDTGAKLRPAEIHPSSEVELECLVADGEPGHGAPRSKLRGLVPRATARRLAHRRRTWFAPASGKTCLWIRSGKLKVCWRFGAHSGWAGG